MIVGKLVSDIINASTLKMLLVKALPYLRLALELLKAASRHF